MFERDVSGERSQPEMGPAVKAPKLRREATQLCCSRSSLRLEPAGHTRLGRTSGCAESCGRAGADQDRTVPSPKEPRVAKSVAEKHVKVRAGNYFFVQVGHCVTSHYRENMLASLEFRAYKVLIKTLGLISVF